MMIDDSCELCGYDRRGGARTACPECGFSGEPTMCLLARNPNEPREVAMQLVLLLVTLGVGVLTFFTFRNVLLVPAPFMAYAAIVLGLLIAVIAIFQFHHRHHGWTLVLELNDRGLTCWSRRLLAPRHTVLWTHIRSAEVSLVRNDVHQIRLRYHRSFWTVSLPPCMLFVAADNERALGFAASIASRAARSSVDLAPVAAHPEQ